MDMGRDTSAATEEAAMNDEANFAAFAAPLLGSMP
jgi:hypothetical protein